MHRFKGMYKNCLGRLRPSEKMSSNLLFKCKAINGLAIFFGSSFPTRKRAGYCVRLQSVAGLKFD